MYPNDRRYSKEHEWVMIEPDGRALVGITHYAQDHLGDVVFVDLPKPGAKVAQFQKLGEVESVKAVSDIFSPVAGQVAEVNERLTSKPELLNQDPYGMGWIARLSAVNRDDAKALMSAQEYEAYLKQLE
ncbi:MAG: glycine cleavage system protein GcvH [Chloroflexi bacterium]|nr:glycine cleavage system protein GcvH [Chloroflexota bacterium]